MSIVVIEEPVTVLGEYASIPIAFEVRDVFDVVEEASGHVRLEAHQIPVSYMKDYDGLGESPMRWAERFDLSNWAFFSAFTGAQCVGRAAIARDTPTLEMLEGRQDLALLWDIRVAPSARVMGSVRPSSIRRSSGPPFGVAFNSRSKRRTSTWPPAASMRNVVA